MENALKSTVNGPDIQLFDNWVRKNYGGNSRTKTITREKYMKICALLRGEQTNSNAKFRFWVRSKGFRLLRHDRSTEEIVDDLNGQLYVSLHAKEESTPMIEGSIENFLRTNLPAISFFRKVAIVDEFYDVIKVAHIDEKGKHAGQKKTYRLVSDTYAFLPREVITFYLLNCDTCKPRIQKYGPIQAKNRQNAASSVASSSVSSTVTIPETEQKLSPAVPLKLSPTNRLLGDEKSPSHHSEHSSTDSATLSSRSPPVLMTSSVSPHRPRGIMSFSYDLLERYKSPSSAEDEIIDPVGDYENPKPISPYGGSTSPVQVYDHRRPPMLLPHRAYPEDGFYRTSKHAVHDKFYGRRYEPYATATRREHSYKESNRDRVDIPLHIDIRPYDFASTYIHKQFLHPNVKPSKELIDYNMYAKQKANRDSFMTRSHYSRDNNKLNEHDRYLLKQRDVVIYEKTQTLGPYPQLGSKEKERHASYRDNIPYHREEHHRRMAAYEEYKLKHLHNLMHKDELMSIYKDRPYQRPVLPLRFHPHVVAHY